MNMFIGELCCIFAYFYVRRKERQKYGNEHSPEEKEALEKGLKLDFNPIWFVIPALFDVASSTLMYVGLNLVNASVMQILNTTILVWIAIFSFVYLGRRYKGYQYVALFVLFSGVAVVGLGSIINSTPGSDTKPLGIIILVISMAFAGLLMVAEEKLLSKYYAHPLQIVGVEGAAGLAVYTVALFILYFIPCTYDKDSDFCPWGRLEDAPRAIKEIFSNGLLAFTVITTIVSLGTYNYFGVSLTKYASATHRAAVNAVRPFTVWIAALAIQWENFFFIQLAGYIIAVYGLLLYYGIIPLNPFALFMKKEESETSETATGTKMIDN